MERIWALLREVAWTSVLSVVLLVLGILSGFLMPDFLGLTVALVGGSATLAVLLVASRLWLCSMLLALRLQIKRWLSSWLRLG